VTFLCQRKQEFKLVDQKETPRLPGNGYHDPGKTDIQNVAPGSAEAALTSAPGLILRRVLA